MESVLVATCLPLEVVPPTEDEGEAAEAVVGDFDSKIEIRSLIPFFIAGELMLVCLIKTFVKMVSITSKIVHNHALLLRVPSHQYNKLLNKDSLL